MNHVVCFDLGGVLVRICRTWVEACGYADLEVREAEWLASSAWRSERKHVVDRYQRGEITCEAYYEALSGAVQGLYSAPEIERVHAAWTREQYPGVEALIDDLHARPGVRTACLSNTNHAHWLRLVGTAERRDFPVVARLHERLASHQLGVLKPDLEIYARAHTIFAQQGALRREQVVFFDDLPENVEGARAFGWTAQQIDPSGDPAAQMRAHLTALGVA